MRFHQEQRFEGGWRWFWAGVMLGPGAVAVVVLFGVAAATGADLTPTLLLLAGLEVVALLGLILILRTPALAARAGVLDQAAAADRALAGAWPDDRRDLRSLPPEREHGQAPPTRRLPRPRSRHAAPPGPPRS